MSYVWSLLSVAAGAVAWRLLLGEDVRNFASVLGSVLVVCIAVSLSAGLMGLRRGIGSKILSTIGILLGGVAALAVLTIANAH